MGTSEAVVGGEVRDAGVAAYALVHSHGVLVELGGRGVSVIMLGWVALG